MEMNEETLKLYLKIDEVNYYTQDQLRYYFSLIWKESQTSFAKKYNINQGNFSSWMRNKKPSNVASETVRNLIREFLGSPKKEQIRCKNMEIRHIFDLVKENQFKYERLYFIDVDNLIGTFINNSVPKICSNEKYLFIFVISSSNESQNIAVRLNRSNFYVTVSNSGAKNAADIILTSLASSLNISLSGKIDFYLVSNDGFISALRDTLISLGMGDRKVMGGKPEEIFIDIEENVEDENSFEGQIF